MTYRFPLISYLRATVGKHPEATRFMWLSIGWFVAVGTCPTDDMAREIVVERQTDGGA